MQFCDRLSQLWNHGDGSDDPLFKQEQETKRYNNIWQNAEK